MHINTTNIIPVIRNAYYFAILHYFLYNNERSITALFQLFKGTGSPDGYGFCWHVWIDLGLKESPPGIKFFYVPPSLFNKEINVFLRQNVKLGWLNNVSSVWFVNVSWFPIGQQYLQDFFYHLLLLPIGYRGICKKDANGREKSLIQHHLLLVMHW